MRKQQSGSPVCHGGDIYRNRVQYDFSINLNPLGMPEGVKKRLLETVEDWACYPDPQCEALRRALAGLHRVKMEHILCSNGAADLIYQLTRMLKPKRALLFAPGFAEYEQALALCGCRTEYEPLLPEEQFLPDTDRFCARITEETDLIFVCNPNNPTGHAVPKRELMRLAERCQETGTWMILDECFCDLMDEPERYSMVSEAERFSHLFILRAFTKTYAMAGLRLGYGICSDETLMRRLTLERQPWSISVPAQEAGCAALEETAYLETARVLLKTERETLTAGLRRLGLTVFDSDINFILFYRKEENGCAAETLYEACLKRGGLLRDCSNFTGLTQGYYRVCVGRPEENQALLRILEQILAGSGSGNENQAQRDCEKDKRRRQL